MVREELLEKMKGRKYITAIISASLISGMVLVAVIWNKPLIWDAAIYQAMGKYLVSGGSYGLWEVFRPPLLPIIASIQQFLGIPAQGFSRFFSVLISTGVLGMTYIFGRELLDEKVALISTGVLGATAVFVRYSPEYLTGIPASGLVLASLYMVRKERKLLAGILGASAFLMRFPAALIGPAVIIYYSMRFLRHRDLVKYVKGSALYTSGFMALAVPYFLINAYFYGNPLAPIVRGVAVPASNPDTYLIGLYYLVGAIKSNPLHLALIPGVYMAYRNSREAFELLAPATALYYLFFSVFPHKETRFLLLFLPLISIFTAKGVVEAGDRYLENIDLNKALTAVLAAGIVLVTAATGYIMTPVNQNSAAFYSNHSSLEGTVAANDATIMAYGDFKYHALPPGELEGAYSEARQQADYISINSCSWYCTPSIDQCEQKIDDLEQDAEQSYEKTFELNTSTCTYRIYETGGQN